MPGIGKVSGSINVENVQMFPGVGPLLALGYVACLTYSELLVTVTKRLNEVTFIWFVALCYSVVFIPILVATRQNPWSPFSCRDRILLFGGGVSEMLCHVFIILAVIRAPFGDVVAIWSTAIVLVPIIECLIAPYSKGVEKQKTWIHKILQLGFAIMACLGVVVLTRPSFLFPIALDKVEAVEKENAESKRVAASGDVLYGYMFAVGNAFSATASYTIVSQLDHVRWAVVDFYFIPAAFIMLPFLTLFFEGFVLPPGAWFQDYMAAIICGLLDVVGAIFCTLSQKIISASTLTLVSTLEIPLSYLLDYVFNGIYPTWSTFGGASLVMTSVVGATVHSIVLDAKIQRKTRNTQRSLYNSISGSRQNTERMPIFGDEREGEDESEEGELFKQQLKKEEDIFRMKENNLMEK